MAALTAPAALAWTPPVTVYRTGSGTASTFTTSYDEAERKALITPVTTYYVRKGSSIENNGTSLGTAIPSADLAVALGKATGQAFKVNYEAALPGDTPVVYSALTTFTRVAAPAATYAETWGGQTFSGATVNAIFEPSVAGGIAHNFLGQALGTWTSTSDANVWKRSGGDYRKAHDLANRNADWAVAMPLARTTANSADEATAIATVNTLWTTWNNVTSPNGWYAPFSLGAAAHVSGTNTTYVRLFDNRQPDASLYLLSTSPSPPRVLDTGQRFYFEGLYYYGGGAAGPFFVRGGSGLRPQVDFVRCGFGSSADAAAVGAPIVTGTDAGTTAIEGCDVIAYQSVSAGSNLDGFTCSGDNRYPILDCAAFVCGWTTGLANNSSTLHQTSKALRQNFLGVQAQDRSIHDVHDTASWNLGCKISTRRGSDASQQSAAYAVGHPTDPGATLMWLDACKYENGIGGAPQYPTEAYPTGTLYYANLDFVPTAGPSSGTVTAYTP